MSAVTVGGSDSGSPPKEVAALIDRMQSLAADGEWAALEACMPRLRTLILGLPAADRRPALLVLRTSTDAIAAEARSVHAALTDKLARMRRGRQASEAYKMR